jgi:hypothetical protein
MLWSWFKNKKQKTELSTDFENPFKRRQQQQQQKQKRDQNHF